MWLPSPAGWCCQDVPRIPSSRRGVPDRPWPPGCKSEPACWDLSYFVPPSQRRKVRYFPAQGGRRGKGTSRVRGGQGGGVPGGCPAPRPSPLAPFPSPPYTHPEVKSCCTLSSRSRRVSSISATASPPLRSQTAAAALGTPHLPLAYRSHSQPAPPRLRFGSGPSTAAPSASAPSSRAFAPPLPGLRSRSGLRRAPASEKGRCFPPRWKSRGFDSSHSLNLGPLVFLFKMKVVLWKRVLSRALFWGQHWFLQFGRKVDKFLQSVHFPVANYFLASGSKIWPH